MTQQKIKLQFVDLTYIENNAKYYILCYDDNFSIAIINPSKKHRMQDGYRIKREWSKEEGYHYQVGHVSIDVLWCLSEVGGKYDLTTDFNVAKNLAKRHVK